MPQAAALFRVYSSSPRQDPPDPLRVSGAWGCVVGVLAIANLLSTPAEAGLRTWIALWFSYGLAGLLFTHFLCTRWVRRWSRSVDPRSAKRRAGKEGVGTCRSRRAPV